MRVVIIHYSAGRICPSTDKPRPNGLTEEKAMNRKKVPMKRTAALLLALALLLACAPAAMAETFSAIVTADSMDVYSDRALTQQMSSLPASSSRAIFTLLSPSGCTCRPKALPPSGMKDQLVPFRGTL